MIHSFFPCLILINSHRPVELYPGLYIGSIKCAKTGTNLLKEYGINHVLTVCHEQRPEPVEGISYYYFPIWDKQTEELQTILPQTHECIDNARKQNQKILVHCLGGISRSGAVCISYIMKEKKQKFLPTWRQCKEKRAVIHPNEGFKEQLTIFESKISL